MRFFFGDDNGQLKIAKATCSDAEWKVDISTVDNCFKIGRTKAIQKLAVYQHDKVSVAHADGFLSLLHIPSTDEPPSLLKVWSDSRFKPDERFVGSAFTNEGHVISCTNNGHLSIMKQTEDPSHDTPQYTVVPKRLCDWQLSLNAKNFIYGGEEVEVSLWDTERAFDPTRNTQKPEIASQSKKRKSSGSNLLDGEIWKAKNVPNDFLNLRQPVHNTALAFVSHSSGTSFCHILSGTRLGSIRRYDTRAARKPVADWRDIGRLGGINKIEKGNTDHEVFVSDCGSTLSALDLRTGRVLYAYGGLAGTVSSIASTSSEKPSLLASTSLDRYFRLHSTDRTCDKKPDTLMKLWTKTTPTCVAWDSQLPEVTVDEDDENIDTIWNGIPDLIEGNSSESEHEGKDILKKRRKT